MFDLEETIKKTENLTNKSQLISDYFYSIYNLINSIPIPKLNQFYNTSFLEEMDSELDIIIKKLKYVENEIEKLELRDVRSNLKLKNNIETFEVEIIKSIHKGNFLIQNIIDQAKLEESHEKRNLIQ